jgi:uncharacterized protein involved in exopolysaccharide biosynthesis
MTIEDIQSRIEKLQSEQSQLNKVHQEMVAQFQRTVAANQTRYAQLTGAINELTDLKNSNGAKL